MKVLRISMKSFGNIVNRQQNKQQLLTNIYETILSHKCDNNLDIDEYSWTQYWFFF